MLQFIWIYAYLFGNVKSEGNPCIDYQTVNDSLVEMDRDGTGGSGPCKPFPESFKPSWYRVNGILIGNVVALECPHSFSCGGTTNIWINDTLPGNNDEIKDVIACGSTSEGCCAIRSRINVKNCKHFYVFELRRLPQCDAKYCFNMTVNGLETELQRSETSVVTSISTESSSVLFTTKENVASKSTNATTSISSSSFQTHSSGLFTTREQVTSKSTTTISSSSAPSKSFSSPVSTVPEMPHSKSIIPSKPSTKEDVHLMSTTDQRTQEMSNEFQSRTIAVITVSTGQTTRKSTRSDTSLILTVTVSAISVLLAILICVVVIVCIRRRRNVHKRKRRDTSLQIRFYSTSKDYHL